MSALQVFGLLLYVFRVRHLHSHKEGPGADKYTTAITSNLEGIESGIREGDKKIGEKEATAGVLGCYSLSFPPLVAVDLQYISHTLDLPGATLPSTLLSTWNRSVLSLTYTSGLDTIV